MTTASPPAEGKILDNIVYFARTLRKAGMPVGPAKVVEAVRAVEVAGLRNREDLYWTLHAVFVSKRDQREVFDEAFRIYWRSRGLVEKMLAILSPVAPPRGAPEPPKAGQTRVSQAFDARRQESSEQVKPKIEVDASFTVSGREKLQSKDFAQMTAEELAEARKALAAMRLPQDRLRQRRLVAASSGRIDPRRSFRASLRAGGDVIALRHARPQEKRPPLVVLCDVSGSMSQYSRLFLHFLHAVTEERRDVHSFVFGTRLTNITRSLRQKDPDVALAACSDGVKDWSGGTRIATALRDFNLHWSRRVLSGNPTVLLITDGLERDTDEDLAREMDRLHRSCRRLIWLNPLLRFDRFEPKARGIRAMLPHVDEFRAAHSLDAISELVQALSADAPNPRLKTPKDWLKAHTQIRRNKWIG
ncbi:vWA domain-containing protein [Roseibium aestuarii]|uniref:VWA domain-containing protein n=1 Tax=Roseibium aestuarii TaxID=2600299 RepID=A0ABW4JX36_9HYPH|nr:VWA domain-containing protein [Roseibium aestuarii]